MTNMEIAELELAKIAPQIRLVEQQAWLDRLPYQNAEHKCIVKDAHEHLSEDARVLIGLVLHYPDIVVDELNNTPSDYDWTVRKGNRDRPYGKGRTLNYIKRKRKMKPKKAVQVYGELKSFVHTLGKYTRATDYFTVATGAMLERYE